jgi:NAD(P)H-flavin reductase
LRNGVAIGFSCRQGACQSCLVKVTEGEIGPEAQHGLKPAWRAQRYALGCRTAVNADLAVEPVTSAPSVPAQIARIEALAQSVMCVSLRTETPLRCESGQFIHLVRSDGLVRPYSLARVAERQLELHVAVRSHQGMSRWLACQATIGDSVTLRGPYGECFYLPGNPDQKMVLAATGTGIAPLAAIVHSALSQNHRGPIWLYHGSRSAHGLYLWEELRASEGRHDNLNVVGCVGENELRLPGVSVERLEHRLRRDHPSLRGARVFLCGNPEVVRTLKKEAYLAGASLADIHSDPFVVSPTAE